MEVHRIASQQTTLAKLLEFHALDLQLFESLAEHDMAAIHVVGCLVRKWLFDLVTGGDDPDAACQQRHRGTGFGLIEKRHGFAFLHAIRRLEGGAERGLARADLVPMSYCLSEWA